MAMVNMGTFSTVNGTQEYTTVNVLTANGSATNESILIYSFGTIGVSPASAITIDFLRCNLKIENPIPATQWFNISEAALSYNADDNNRFSTGSALNFEDCSIITNSPSIKAIFLSNCTNTRIFNAGATMLTYTQEGANINNMHLENTNWEVNGQPSEASNIKLVNSGITNFLVPRLDFSYINLTTGANNLTMATGNGGVLACNFWNIILFDNTKIQHQAVGNRYYDGCSASWLFQDRDLATPVEDILLINSSDKSGSMTELGRYTTNSSGLTVGTYDSRFETTGANQVRDALFLFENLSDQAGSDFTNGGLSYSIVAVVNQIEIRSYLHEAPAGFIVGDDYTLGEQGSISSDYSTDTPLIFTMNNDLNITETNTAIVLAYTDLGDPLKLYDRHKIEWRDNDGYALVKRVGNQLDLSTINLTLDATAASVYVANTTDITAKAAIFTGGIPSIIGSFTVTNGTLLDGGVFEDDVNYFTGPSTITNITVTSGNTVDFNTAGTYTIDGSTLDIVTNSSGGAITLLLTNSSTVATNTGPNITLIQNVDVTNANLLDGTRVQLYNITKDAELDNSVVSGGTGYSFEVNLLSAAVDPGDTLRIRGTYIDGVTGKDEYQEAGTITTSGLPFIGVQDPSPEYDTWGLDGSLITKFTANYIADRVAIALTGPWQVAELGAWWQYNLTTEQGIREFFSGVTFIDEANIGVNIATVDIFLDTSLASGTAFQEDNRRFFRIGDESTRPVENPTTGGGAVDVEWRSPVTIANSDNVATKANQVAINEGVKKSSFIRPHTANLPDL